MEKDGILDLIIKSLLIFLAITGATTLFLEDVQFGQVTFWETRGVFFLFFITLFPRLTLLFSSVAFGGIFWWLGFFFAPRVLVAFLATFAYWETNPVLVTISWIIALSGETSEKYVIVNNRHKARDIHKTFRGQTIEAEFEVKDKKEL